MRMHLEAVVEGGTAYHEEVGVGTREVSCREVVLP